MVRRLPAAAAVPAVYNSAMNIPAFPSLAAARPSLAPPRHTRLVRCGRLALVCLAALAAAAPAGAEESGGASAAAKPPPPGRWETSHSIEVGGETVEYDAVVTGIQLDNDDGAPAAQLWYTAYFRTNGAPPRERPLVFSYNGGPGSASFWLHMGIMGPRRVVTPDVGPQGAPPYPLEDNAWTILDIADIVMVDPVGTGFSHTLGETPGSDYWGIDEDAKSLAPVRPAVPQQARPLELAPLPARRELRHDPVGGARRPPAAREHRPERDRPRLVGAAVQHDPVRARRRRRLHRQPAVLRRRRPLPGRAAGGQPGRSRRPDGRGRGMGAHRLRHRTASRRHARRGHPRPRGRPPAPLHRALARLHREVGPAGDGAGLRGRAAARRGEDRRPPGRALHRPGRRHAGDAAVPRSAVHGDQLGLHVGVQRLPAERARLRRRPRVRPERRRPRLELGAGEPRAASRAATARRTSPPTWPPPCAGTRSSKCS